MKKLFVSVGLVVAGTSAVCAAGGAAMGMGDNSKNWSVSATLRGFYDDNYATSTSANKRDSFGVMIRPSVSYSLPLDNTSLGLQYTFGATWYQDRAKINDQNNAWDMSHQLAAFLDHNFSDKTALHVMNSFVISQEPELLQSGPLAVPYRTEGDNIRNHGEINFNGTLTQKFKYVLGYQNTYYDYENEGGNEFQPSLSAILDRFEHRGVGKLLLQAGPKSVLSLGYTYSQVDYTSDEPIRAVPFATSENRNNRGHAIHVGLDQNFTKDLLFSVLVGAQRTEYNDPLNDDTTTPYISAKLAYTYRPGSTFTLGYTHSRNQTDVLSPIIGGPLEGQLTTDAESSVIYASLSHRFNAKVTGILQGQWQNSEFNGGNVDGQKDTFVDISGALVYRFNPHLTGEVGYSFSQLTTDIALRDYERNRIYLGLTATY